MFIFLWEILIHLENPNRFIPRFSNSYVFTPGVPFPAGWSILFHQVLEETEVETLPEVEIWVGKGFFLFFFQINSMVYIYLEPGDVL